MAAMHASSFLWLAETSNNSRVRFATYSLGVPRYPQVPNLKEFFANIKVRAACLKRDQIWSYFHLLMRRDGIVFSNVAPPMHGTLCQEGFLPSVSLTSSAPLSQLPFLE